jgi:DNA-binding response OmpR family regulator
MPQVSPILVVEDDPTIADVLETLLREEGFHCTVCRDGCEVYDTIQASHPALVILDLHLPGRDGIELLRDVKGDPDTAAIPILVCSVENALLRQNADRLKKWGCRTVEKPFDIDVLIATVRDMVRNDLRSKHDAVL